MNNEKRRFMKKVRLSVIIVSVIIIVSGFVTVTGTFAQESSGTGSSGKELTAYQAEVAKFGLIAAALAFGLGALGAGIAISHVGAAAMGAIAEKPEVASQALIFIALAEGLVVFGFIAALMILGKF